MLQGFEEYTAPLTDYERDDVLPRVVHFLSLCNGSENAVKNGAIVKHLRYYGCNKVGEARVRKVINHIRIHALVRASWHPVAATTSPRTRRNSTSSSTAWPGVKMPYGLSAFQWRNSAKQWRVIYEEDNV